TAYFSFSLSCSASGTNGLSSTIRFLAARALASAFSMIGVAAAASFSNGSPPFIPSLASETCAGRMTTRLMTSFASPGLASLSLGCNRCPIARTGANRMMKNSERKKRARESEVFILRFLLLSFVGLLIGRGLGLQRLDAAHNHQTVHRRRLQLKIFAIGVDRVAPLALFLIQLADTAPGGRVIRFQLGSASVELFGFGVIALLHLPPRRSGGAGTALLLRC